MLTTVLFYVLAAILVTASVRVVTARNPVHAALFLVLAFFNASGIWMLLRAEFLAITLVLVYVGAVMVLFLFVVMMLDINVDVLRAGFRRNLPVALVVGAVVIVEMAFVLYTALGANPVAAPALPADSNNTRELGRLVYTDYVFPFEIAAVLLLVAIIAAIALTLRGRKDSKHQVVSQQLAVRKADRLRIVDLKSQRELPDPPAEA